MLFDFTSIKTRQDYDNIPDDVFIQIYKQFGSSRKLHTLFNGVVPRSSIDVRYYTVTFKPIPIEKTCAKCSKVFTHTPKSYRDSTKLCKECRVDIFKEKALSQIIGKPSHRRRHSDDSQVLSELQKAIEDTHFVRVEPNPEDTSIAKLTCCCGNVIYLSVKRISQNANTKKKSCGCVSNRQSAPEKEIEDFLKEHGLEALRNTRPKFMNGLELDFYLPELKFAIEFHGLAFHSERYTGRSLYQTKVVHENKYLFCKAQDITLVQIFEDEWNSSKNLLKEMLLYRLGLSDKLLRKQARKLEVKVVENPEAATFFSENHIGGHGGTHPVLVLGLYDGPELCSALSFRKPWNKKYGEATAEIARFANKAGISVAGGFSRLLSYAEYILKEQGYTAILTYSDCRFGEGAVYLNNGFSFLGKTKPNYFYERAGKREHRFKHRRKAELPGTEREQNQALGWYAIYDAGNNIYLKKLVL